MDLTGVYAFDVDETYDLNIDVFHTFTKDYFYLYQNEHGENGFIRYHEESDNHGRTISCCTGQYEIINGGKEIRFDILKFYKDIYSSGCGYNTDYSGIENFNQGEKIITCDLIIAPKQYLVKDYEYKYYKLNNENVIYYSEMENIDELKKFILEKSMNILVNNSDKLADKYGD